MKYLLLHSPTWAPCAVRDALAGDEVETRVCPGPEAIAADGRPTVLVLDPGARAWGCTEPVGRLVAEGGAVIALAAAGERDVPPSLPHDILSAFLPADAGPRQFLVALRAAYRETVARRSAMRARRESVARTSELEELTEIGRQLTTERDYHRLLELILEQACRLSQADAGSIYIVETAEDGARRLRFILARNESRPDISFAEFTIPLDHTSLAGYAAKLGAPLVLDDVYAPPAGAAYRFNRSFDERHGYRTKSMLAIPMENHLGEVIGVLQLINRKRSAADRLLTPQDAERSVVPFTHHTVKLMKALAGQAAVSLENSQLYQSIERLFEGFVRAAVTAIEQRDPATSGHSERVALMTVGLAETVDRADDGAYRYVRFSREQLRELRYAGLLHDFGKVGVREEVLLKAKKLYPWMLALVRERQAFAIRTVQWRFERERAAYLERHGRGGYDRRLAELAADRDREVARLERFLRMVQQYNEPTVLPEGDFAALEEFVRAEVETLDGHRVPLLTPEELRFLTIRKGSLDEAERLEIQSHVTHTYTFLRNIPWTKELAGVPEIARGHHEKLNGEGYPRRVRGTEIPIQTRMMTIADIFDALTAADRPYKRAVPPVRALEIIEDEVRAGMLDAELFRLFVTARVWELGTKGER
ncbi:MAG TPA: HD domain-containing phosphohydrolase [Gemmatimonadales bacterium]|nr:HD domain-containing phosphohydrolase [Gemmatimonadales bacterium]